MACQRWKWLSCRRMRVRNIADCLVGTLGEGWSGRRGGEQGEGGGDGGVWGG